MFQWLCSLFVLYNGFSNRKTTTNPPSNNRESPIENIWHWEHNGISHKIHYEKYPSKDTNKYPALILIHGFGASTFHWRDNIPTLSERYTVYAFDLLGFGASDKPIIDYTTEIWRIQTTDFVKKVHLEMDGRPVVLIGNSIGGYISVQAAAYASGKASEELISAIILLNPVAVFRGKELPFSASWLSWFFQPFIFRWMFQYFRNEVNSTLLSLYPHHPERVDAALVRSIQEPANHPNASEVFCRILRAQLLGPHPYMDDLLSQISIPLYLIVGKDDPWLLSNLYTDFLEKCPTAFGKKVDAGHCPHDENPAEINRLIYSFLTLCSVPNK